MEESKTSPSPRPPTTTTTTVTPSATSPRRKPRSSTASRMKRSFLSFFASLQESFNYVKATIIGQVKKMRARNEKEAADAAEDTQMKLQKSV